MKCTLKNVFLGLVILVAAMGIARAQQEPTFLQYFIVGRFQLPQGVEARTQQVVVYETRDQLDRGNFAVDTLNTALSNSGEVGRFMVNALNIPDFAVGKTYFVAVPLFTQGGITYGADPLMVTITGRGYETLSQPLVIRDQSLPPLPPEEQIANTLRGLGLTDPQIQTVLNGIRGQTITPQLIESIMNQLAQQGVTGAQAAAVRKYLETLAANGGRPPAAPEPPTIDALGLAPKIKIFINDVEYDPKAVEKFGAPQSGPKPKIRIQFLSGWGVDTQSVGMTREIKGQQPTSITIASTAVRILAQPNGSTFPTNFEINRTIEENEKFPEGTNNITVRASNFFGSATRTASMQVTSHVGIRDVVIRPQPYAPSRGSMQIAYILNTDTDIQVLIYSISGENIKQFKFTGGVNGGKADYNEVVWDGSTDSGTRVANGIYVGAITDMANNKLLQKFRFVVLDQ